MNINRRQALTGFLGGLTAFKLPNLFKKKQPDLSVHEKAEKKDRLFQQGMQELCDLSDNTSETGRSISFTRSCPVSSPGNVEKGVAILAFFADPLEAEAAMKAISAFSGLRLRGYEETS